MPGSQGIALVDEVYTYNVDDLTDRPRWSPPPGSHVRFELGRARLLNFGQTRNALVIAYDAGYIEVVGQGSAVGYLARELRGAVAENAAELAGPADEEAPF